MPEVLKLPIKELMNCSDDARTTRGQIKEILRQVRIYGGYSIFWITSNRKRASIATDMVESGVIVPSGGNYPWCSMLINWGR